MLETGIHFRYQGEVATVMAEEVATTTADPAEATATSATLPPATTAAPG